MPAYRKKPVEIEAELYDGSPASIAKIQQLGRGKKIVIHHDHLNIPTLEGVHRADIGDYIVRGVEGELYPCKNSVFTKTYEVVH